jgi:hypothetical protein
MPTGVTEPSAAQFERRARVMRWVNVVMRALLSVPFRTPLSSRLMLVQHRGRRTGRIYRQPVSYVRDADMLLTPGGGNWTRNLDPENPVVLRLEGRKVWARPDLVRAEAEVKTLLGRMLASNRRLASFVPFVERDGTVDPAKLHIALQRGFCIVRWQIQGRGVS